MLESVEKQLRYPWAVIETAILLYECRGLTFRGVSQELTEHGVVVSHKTVFEWVNKYANDLKVSERPTTGEYEIQESYVKCNGVWRYMYRAVSLAQAPAKGHTLSVYLRENRNLSSARSFFRKRLSEEWTPTATALPLSISSKSAPVESSAEA